MYQKFCSSNEKGYEIWAETIIKNINFRTKK